MELPDEQADPKEVELTEENDTPPPKSNNQERLTVDVEITFWTHVGWDGVLVMLFSLGIAGLFIYLAYEYTFYFQNWNRSFVWLFIVFSILYVLLAFKFLFAWHKLAKQFTEDQNKNSNVEDSEDEAASDVLCLESVKKVPKKIKTFYAKTQLTGTLFLWKLYISELMESAQQCSNLVLVYLCSLPIQITITFCVLLALDAFYTGWGMISENIPSRRDRQVKIDTFVDFFCLAIPLFVIWFVYGVPISIHEMFYLTLVPAISLLGKLDDILEEIIRHRCALQVLEKQRRLSSFKKRHRESLFGTMEHLSTAKKQQENIPVIVRKLAMSCKLLFGLFFLAVAIAHLLLLGNGPNCVAHRETATLWKACQVKVPYCGTLFESKCNCVVLTMKKHNMTKLPPLFGQMTALKKIEITHGPLKSLPEDMGLRLSRISFLTLDFNNLKTLPTSLGNSPNLLYLFVSFNRLENIPTGLWQHEYLRFLDFSTNNISQIDEAVNLPNIAGLYLANNTLTILPNKLATNHALLSRLDLDGNYLTVLPDNFGHLNKSLHLLTLARNNLTAKSFPLSFHVLKKLVTIDLRNNSIEAIPPFFEDLESLEELLVYGNPLCQSKWCIDASNGCGARIRTLLSKEAVGCKKQCSDMCRDGSLAVSGCDIQCNVPECNFDNGACQ